MPQEFDVRERVSQALYSRRPSSHWNGWYIEIADAIGVDPKSVERWLIGDTTIDFANFCSLTKFFLDKGDPSFANEVFGALTGVHCGLSESDAWREASRLKDIIERSHAEAQNVIPYRGKVSSHEVPGGDSAA